MIPPYKIIIDSREQHFWWTPDKDHIRKGLKTGDYSILDHEDYFALERKSIADVVGTLSVGHSRFQRELERASHLRYFAIIIEGGLTKVLGKKYPHSDRSRVSGVTIAKILCTLNVKYGINIFFCKDKEEARTLALLLMESYLLQVSKGLYTS